MRLREIKPPPCSECGSDPVGHSAAYFTVAVDGFLNRLVFEGRMRHVFARQMRRIENTLLPRLYEVLARRGLGEFLDEPDDKTMLLAAVLWKEAAARGILMREFRLFGLPRNMFVARLPSGRALSFEGFPFPDEAGANPAWLNNKAELKKRFQKAGFPVARGAAAFTERGACAVFRELEAPVIVKPHVGSASRHTTLHIGDESALLRAFQTAKQVSPFAVVEEELSGRVYRATVVGGRFAAALRRDEPHIIGDGVHAVGELVRAANGHSARQGPYFSHIDASSPEALEELSRQRMDHTSVPRAGQRVSFHQKVNWSLGGTTADVTDDAHSDNIKLFEDIAAFLATPLVGIDFIIEDIGRSWREAERCGVIECNDMPFFDNHHLPFEGEPRNVAGAIWDLAAA